MTHPPAGPSTPPPPSGPKDLLDDIAVMLDGAQSWATLLPERDVDPALRMALTDRLRLARRAVADLQSPARFQNGPANASRLVSGREGAGAVRAASAVRAGDPSLPGADFKLPPPPFVIGVGVQYDVLPPVDDRPYRERVAGVRWPGRPFPRHTVPAAQVWQPSTPGQPPTSPPPDPHPQD